MAELPRRVEQDLLESLRQAAEHGLRRRIDARHRRHRRFRLAQPGRTQGEIGRGPARPASRKRRETRRRRRRLLGAGQLRSRRQILVGVLPALSTNGRNLRRCGRPCAGPGLGQRDADGLRHVVLEHDVAVLVLLKGIAGRHRVITGDLAVRPFLSVCGTSPTRGLIGTMLMGATGCSICGRSCAGANAVEPPPRSRSMKPCAHAGPTTGQPMISVARLATPIRRFRASVLVIAGSA